MPVYWLVDLVKRRLEVRTGPWPDGEYAEIRILEPGQEVEIPGADRVAVAELLP